LSKIAAEFKKNPQKGSLVADSLIAAGMTSAGALLGAESNPDDPWLGALIGAGAGLGTGLYAPVAFRQAQAHLRDPNLDPALAQKGKEQLAHWLMDKLHVAKEMAPDYYRASVLSKPDNLFINAVVGPYGSAVMGSLEYALAGDKRGWVALRKLTNPLRFFKEYGRSWAEAGERVSSATERMGGDIGQHGPNAFRWAVKQPAQVLTAGDVASRKILMESGFSELEARIVNMTSEPVSGLAKSVGNAAKTKGPHGHQSWALRMMLPFYRTNANQLEQNLMRLPVLGPALRHYWRQAPLSLRHSAVQQGMSAGVLSLAYMAGSIIPPDQQRIWLKGINNFGGVYGTTAALGFIAGTANQNGDPKLKQISKAAIGMLRRDLPLPSLDIGFDLIRAFDAALDNNPKTHVNLPYGVVPPFLSSKETMSVPSLMRPGKPPTKNEYSVMAPYYESQGYKLAPRTGYKEVTPMEQAIKERDKRMKQFKERQKQLRAKTSRVEQE
jgi:hypothetical protein